MDSSIEDACENFLCCSEGGEKVKDVYSLRDGELPPSFCQNIFRSFLLYL
ncbi:MAG: hypothetical protein CM1200mP4_5630 [Rhodospirillaceae bacterium]|nr:MAG: hypothetical protein CM1200mP4_5630 [Rhodospirillaceae bacterium]